MSELLIFIGNIYKNPDRGLVAGSNKSLAIGDGCGLANVHIAHGCNETVFVIYNEAK